MEETMDVLDAVITGRRAPTFATLEEFWTFHLENARGLERPVDRAIAGGAAADRLGFAFAAGYAAALHALVPGLDAGTLASLAATEDGGAHPKAIRTALTRAGAEGSGGGWHLTGVKRWVTLAGRQLFVLAAAGLLPDGRSRLVLVRIPGDRTGVRFVPLPPAPFVPEIPHAEVHLEQVPVSDAEILPGDGWERWVKPFRTVEDIHVHAALLAFLGATGARAGWPRSLREQMVSGLIALQGLALADPSSPVTHVALGGAIGQARQLVDATAPYWSSVPEPVRQAWERDRSLLEVAGKARALRLDRAWERLPPA
jgi:acyl-CoA dehydrogenase